MTVCRARRRQYLAVDVEAESPRAAARLRLTLADRRLFSCMLVFGAFGGARRRRRRQRPRRRHTAGRRPTRRTSATARPSEGPLAAADLKVGVCVSRRALAHRRREDVRRPCRATSRTTARSTRSSGSPGGTTRQGAERGLHQRQGPARLPRAAAPPGHVARPSATSQLGYKFVYPTPAELGRGRSRDHLRGDVQEAARREARRSARNLQ